MGDWGLDLFGRLFLIHRPTGRKGDAQEVLGEAKALGAIKLGDAGQARAEVFHQFQVAKDAHQFFVAGDGVALKKLGGGQALGQGAGRGDFDAVGKDFKLGRRFAAVVVVHDGVDHGFAQGHGVPQAAVNAFFGGDGAGGFVFYLQLVEHGLGGFDERAVAVFVVLDQVHTIKATVFGHFDGGVVFVGQQIGGVVERAVVGGQLQIGFELPPKGLALFFVVNAQLLKAQGLAVGFDFANRVAGAVGKEPLNHGGGHGLGGAAHAHEAAFFAQPVFLFGIGLFAAAGHDDFDAVHACGASLVQHVKQSHGRWVDVVFDAVFDLEHVAVHIDHAHALSVFVDTDVDKPALVAVEEGDHFFFQVQLGREFALELDPVVFVGMGGDFHGPTSRLICVMKCSISSLRGNSTA